MSFIIPPPLKIEFPEQLALSDSTNGTRSNVAASEKSVGDSNKTTSSAITSLREAIQQDIDTLSGQLTQMGEDIVTAQNAANSATTTANSAQSSANGKLTKSQADRYYATKSHTHNLSPQIRLGARGVKNLGSKSVPTDAPRGCVMIGCDKGDVATMSYRSVQVKNGSSWVTVGQA